MKLFFNQIALKDNQLIWIYNNETNKLTCTGELMHTPRRLTPIEKKCFANTYTEITVDSHSQMIIEDAKSFMNKFEHAPLDNLPSDRRSSINSNALQLLFNNPTRRARSNSSPDSSPNGENNSLVQLMRSGSSPSNSSIREREHSVHFDEGDKSSIFDIKLDSLFNKTGSDPTSWSDTVAYETYFLKKTSDDMADRKYNSIHSCRTLTNHGTYELNKKLCPVKMQQIILLRILLDHILSPVYQRAVSDHRHIKALRTYFKNAVLNVMKNENFNLEAELESLPPNVRVDKFRENNAAYNLAIQAHYLTAAQIMLQTLAFFIHPTQKGEDVCDKPDVAALLDQLKSALKKSFSPNQEKTLLTQLQLLGEANTNPAFIIELELIKKNLVDLMQKAAEKNRSDCSANQSEAITYLQSLQTNPDIDLHFAETLKHIETLLHDEYAAIEFILSKLQELIILSGKIHRQEIKNLALMQRDMKERRSLSYSVNGEEFQSFYLIVMNKFAHLSVPTDLPGLCKQTLDKAILQINAKYLLEKNHIAKLFNNDEDFFIWQGWANEFSKRLVPIFNDYNLLAISKKHTGEGKKSLFHVKKTGKKSIGDSLDKLSTEICETLISVIEEKMPKSNNSRHSITLVQHKDEKGNTYLKY